MVNLVKNPGSACAGQLDWKRLSKQMIYLALCFNHNIVVSIHLICLYECLKIPTPSKFF